MRGSKHTKLEARLRTSTKTLATLAVPNLFLATLLAAFDARSMGNLLRIAGRGLLDIAAFVFGNLGQGPASQNRGRRYLSDFFFGCVVVPMLNQKPLAI